MSPGAPSLWQYCRYVNELCPELPSVTRMYADLRWATTLFTERHIDIRMGCTYRAGDCGGSVCHVVTNLPTWNEFLVTINVELREVIPGELSLVCLRGVYGSRGMPARERHAVVLLHWLLTIHSCVTYVELDDVVISDYNKYYRVFCDALRRSDRLRKLKVSAWNSSRDATRCLVASIADLSHLEALHLLAVDLSGGSDHGGNLATFATFLGSTTTLKALSMAHVIKYPDNTSLLIEALRKNCTITELCIHTSCFGSGSEDLFGLYVKESVTLVHLILVNAYSDTRGSLVPVLDAISQSKTILKLDLSCFTIEVAEAWSLAHLLERNHNLKSLNLTSCQWMLTVPRHSSPSTVNAETHELADPDRTPGPVLPLAAALGRNSSLIRLTLTMSQLNACEQNALLAAIACNTTLQEVFVETPDSDTVTSLCEAIRETDTARKVHLGFVNVRETNFAHVQTQCKEVTKVFLKMSSESDANAVSECFSLLPSCSHLTSFNVSLDQTVNARDAVFVAEFLKNTLSLREVCMNFYASGSTVQDILKGLSFNTTIQKLEIENWDLDDESAYTLASTVGYSTTIHHLGFRSASLSTCRLLLSCLARCLSTNSTLLSMEANEDLELERDWIVVRDVLRRNAAFVEAGACFVVGLRNKRGAEAFEHISSSSTLLARVQEMALVPCADRAKEMIQEAAKWLREMEPFMKVTGVIKEKLSWDESVEERQRLDSLTIDCWLHVRQYLRVADVVDGLPNGPKRKCSRSQLLAIRRKLLKRARLGR